jgi:hypothetical protein
MNNYNYYEEETVELSPHEVKQVTERIRKELGNEVASNVENALVEGGARKKKSHRQLSKSNVIKHIQKLSKDLGIQSRVTVKFAKKSPAKKSRSRKSPAKKSPAKKHSPKKSSPKRRRTSPKKSSPKRKRASPKAK